MNSNCSELELQWILKQYSAFLQIPLILNFMEQLKSADLLNRVAELISLNDIFSFNCTA